MALRRILNTMKYQFIHATGISLDKSSITLTTAGQTEQLTATVTPADSTDKVTWSSSDTSIATVSQTGLVTCVTPGECTITATINGFSDTCSVVNITPVTTSGIYWSSSLGLISVSSDGSNWTTIADKNLGATQVYNYGDTLSGVNCGKYYQWGNIYAFPDMGTVSFGYSSTKVDASAYGPNNYYNSSTWINVNPRDSTYNYDLYGGVTDTVGAKKGPCDTGYHIPSITEWTNVFNLGVTLGAWSSSSYNNLLSFLKLPLAGIRNGSDTTMLYVNQAAGYRSATRSDANNAKFLLILGTVDLSSHFNNYYGMPIRAFKNEAAQPDNTWTKLY